MESFYWLIDQLSTCSGEERRALEQEIWRSYGVERAVLVLDLSSFSLYTRRSGILDYLQVIRKMHVLSAPIVTGFRGQVVKYEADNLIALFENPEHALRAAVSIRRTLADARIPSVAQEGEYISASIGIDYGRLLLIGGSECVGDPVNIAYKLGEDLAARGEILVSEEAYRVLPEGSGLVLAPRLFSISGLSMTAYVLADPS